MGAAAASAVAVDFFPSLFYEAIFTFSGDLFLT